MDILSFDDLTNTAISMAALDKSSRLIHKKNMKKFANLFDKLEYFL